MTFSLGVCHCMDSFFHLSGIFDKKVGPFSEFLCLLEVQSYPKYDFEDCFGKNGSYFQTNF